MEPKIKITFTIKHFEEWMREGEDTPLRRLVLELIKMAPEGVRDLKASPTVGWH